MLKTQPFMFKMIVYFVLWRKSIQSQSVWNTLFPLSFIYIQILRKWRDVILDSYCMNGWKQPFLNMKTPRKEMQYLFYFRLWNNSYWKFISCRWVFRLNSSNLFPILSDSFILSQSILFRDRIDQQLHIIQIHNACSNIDKQKFMLTSSLSIV